MSLPEYDASLAEHKALVELVKQAHQEHDSKKRANIVAKVRLLLPRSLKLKSHFCQ